MALFDGIQKLTITATQQLFGDVLTWAPSTGGLPQTVKVLYNSPEAKATLGDADKYAYSPYKYWFEYFTDQLTGLKVNVDSQLVETVLVKGKVLCVRDVTLKFDGKTFIAYCDEFVDYKPDPIPEEDE